MPKLNQILAIEKSVKSRCQSEMAKLEMSIQKPTLFMGFSKTYVKKDEDGDNFPPENYKVQLVASEFLQEVEQHLTDLLDTTLVKDVANCGAFGDVVVDGEVIIEKAPVTYLLFLEKQVADLYTFVNKIPVLSTEDEWSLDGNSNLYKTEQILTTKTKKVQKPIVLYDATKEHPAQTQIITEDVIIGHWSTVKQSGALPIPVKKKILARIEKLSKAIKFAREEANSAQTENKYVGKKIFKYIFSESS